MNGGSYTFQLVRGVPLDDGDKLITPNLLTIRQHINEIVHVPRGLMTGWLAG
jgi:hypothetical protein